jgi:hypothetical protein
MPPRKEGTRLLKRISSFYLIYVEAGDGNKMSKQATRAMIKAKVTTTKESLLKCIMLHVD